MRATTGRLSLSTGRRKLIEHEVATLVGQRVFAIALGYEDLNDHDELRLMAVLAGKLEARRADCAPVAGKSTLNRLELSELTPTRYHKISHNPIAIRTLLVDLFLEAHARPPRQIILDLDATDDPLHGEQEGRFVEPQDVILGQAEFADGCFIIDTRVGPMPVVSMQPGR